MSIRRFLAGLRASPEARGRLVCHRRIDARPARYQELAQPLPPRLQEYLARQGIAQLYTHQAQAITAARAGKNVLSITATASGKTLTYNLPVIETLLSDPRSRALYLFPTKALAQDQLGKLRDFHLYPLLKPGTYDGDTPAHFRARYKRELNVVLTNPDMLHVGILPYHGTWATFFRNLKYIVIDEIHAYRGVFGSHVANVLRRLRRICRLYGSDPQFLCCSATVANPMELMQRLLGDGREVAIIDDDGSPRGARHFLFWNPPPLGDGGRVSTNLEATQLLASLVRDGVRTILFTRARKTAELILRYARFALQDTAPELAARITSYRAGYSPEQRREIERALFDGELLGVTSTNALELGIDIGNLHACIIAGYPGSIASTWQQAGRCGRGHDESLVILVALDNPLDQYLMRHPEYFFGSPPEHAIVDPGNPHILREHLLCAAYEHPLQPDPDERIFGVSFRALAGELARDGKVRRAGRALRGAGSQHPARQVNIRSVFSDPYRVVLEETGEILGTVDAEHALETLHPGAVYLHLGESYRVSTLDVASRKALVSPASGDHYTQPRTSVDVFFERAVAQRPLGTTTLCHGPVEVVSQVVGYRRKKLFSEDVLAEVDLELPPQRFRTHGVWFTLPPALTERLVAEEYDLTGSIHAVEHATIGIVPLHVLCDRMDIGGVSHAHHPDTGAPTICIHDAIPGGVGIAEKAYTLLEEILRATLRAIEECPCTSGCPSCIQSPKCGNNNQPLDKAGAEMLLHHLIGE
ncbi:MAG: DEAD/DEAH box helicase [Armatimonadetes bacterium]|nr:DEAD/DEAH box helicase [Armatimonadota bacterium]